MQLMKGKTMLFHPFSESYFVREKFLILSCLVIIRILVNL